MHLILDGECVNKIEKGYVFRFLYEYPAEIKMRIVAEPYVYVKDCDIFGMVILLESHMSVYYSNKGLINIDVFSCKGFDGELVENALVEKFGLVKYNCKIFSRWIDSIESKGV